VGAVTAHERPGTRPGDVLLAVALALFAAAGTAGAGRDQPQAAPLDAWTYVLTTLAAASLVLWRGRPLAVFAATSAAVAVYLGLGYPYGPIMITAAVAAGLLAASVPLRTVAIAGVADAVVLVAVLLVRDVVRAWPEALAHVLGVLVWTALPLAIGVAVRTRREAAARVREEQALRAVADERLRMAQELHDVVGHGLAVIAMQAGAGLHVLARDPAKARAALEAIRTASRDALDGLRAEVVALRGGAPRAPLPGLADLGPMVERVRSGGLDVRLDVDEVDGVPDDVAGAAYRIVQEALTNVLRHGGPSAGALVRVRRAPGRLVVEVGDTGSGPPADGLVEGSGIAGMRERAARTGGSVAVDGPPGTGVRVRASWPLDDDRPDGAAAP
ncbi:sensor histidine kinase, partial [Georgenia ruanii]|nr:sensor histidine kinase [Georgenia ruanii]